MLFNMELSGCEEVPGFTNEMNFKSVICNMAKIHTSTVVCVFESYIVVLRRINK